MRVETTTIEDFCDELKQEKDNIYRKVVRVRVDRVPEQEAEVTFQVGFWATALVKHPDGEWVVEFGRIAGTDGSSHGDSGSEQADDWRDAINKVAAELDLRVRRGKIEIW